MISTGLNTDLRILPWNGRKSAISLTFDDGIPIHLDLAVPELTRRGLKATFFVVAGRLTNPQDWKHILSMGHEIGNHSMEHKHAKDLAPGDEQKQVAEAKKRLEDLLQSPISTFAYPFTETTPALRKAVEVHHFLSRGGNRGDFYLAPAGEPDWMDISSQVALSDLDYGVYQGWLDENLKRGAWTIFQLHGIEGGESGWQPMPKNIFFRLLDELAERRKDCWIATFAEVGAYWRAQKILEQTQPIKEGNKTTYRWSTPPLFPEGMVLKARIAGNPIRVSQAGKPSPPLSSDIYPVSFDLQDLSVETL